MAPIQKNKKLYHPKNQPEKMIQSNFKITNMKAFTQQIPLSSLAAFRKKWGLTQKQVAEHMQLSRSMVGLIEQGRRTVPTNTLLQLAGLEIKMAGITAGGQAKPVYPGADAVVARCKHHCQRLALRELYCQEKTEKLKGKLKIMEALYQKTTEWMNLVTLHIKEAGDNKNVWAIWKQHELAAMRTLDSCSPSSQLLLKHTIDFLQEEAALLKTKQLQVKQELAGIILPTQQTM
jgi:transcriptional regulator with XRE-family HTH domain